MINLNSICVVGLGYIGLPTAAVFADAGLQVHGVDVNQSAVDSINAGKPHIVEPQLDALLLRVVESGKFEAFTKPQPADAFILAVPTPFKNNHEPDLSYIESAAKAIAPCLKVGDLVILESTSPVGATETLTDWLAEARPDLTFPNQKGEHSDIRVAHCPERVLPGKILDEVVNNARVIGGMTRRCTTTAISLYQMVVNGPCHFANARTAEMAKLTENAFRDVNIAFANELSVICDELNINVWELIKMANLHPRVDILSPGPGVGGHCIAVDPWFIISKPPKTSALIKQARNINDNKPEWVVDKIRSKAGLLKKPVIACLGLAYKPNVDDLRESPSIEILQKLADLNVGEILVVEPHIDILPSAFDKKNIVLEDFDVALEKANVVVLLVNHEIFQFVNREKLNDKIVIDTCGGW